MAAFLVNRCCSKASIYGNLNDRNRFFIISNYLSTFWIYSGAKSVCNLPGYLADFLNWLYFAAAVQDDAAQDEVAVAQRDLDDIAMHDADALVLQNDAEAQQRTTGLFSCRLTPSQSFTEI